MKRNALLMTAALFCLATSALAYKRRTRTRGTGLTGNTLHADGGENIVR